MTQPARSHVSRFNPRLWLALLVSALFLVAMYAQLEWRGILAALQAAASGWLLFASVSLIVPLTLMRALRFSRMLPDRQVGLGEATRLTLVVSTLNIALPAKSGDLARSWVLFQRGSMTGGTAVSVVVYERLADLLALFTWTVVAWALSALPFDKPWTLMIPVSCAGVAVSGSLLLSHSGAAVGLRAARRVMPSRRLEAVFRFADGWLAVHTLLGRRRFEIVALTFAMWFVNLSQLWLFAAAVHLDVPYSAFVAIGVLATLAGQIPVALAGIGPRDVALVTLLSPFAEPELGAAVGILAGLRVILPALAGAPFLSHFLLQHLPRT